MGKRGLSGFVLVFLVLLFASPKALAQVLVSNTGQALAGNSGHGVDRAQSFTTGSHAAGYTLTSVTFPAGGNINTGSTQVHIRQSGSNSRPSDSLGTLTLTRSSGEVTGTTEGIDLAASTTYFVTIESTDALGTNTYQRTSSDNEDAGAAAGWSIGNTSFFHSAHNELPNWATATTSQTSWKISIQGTAKSVTASDGVTVSESSLNLTELGSSSTVEKTYTVVLDTDPGEDVSITATVPAANTSEVEVKTGSGAFGNSATLTFTHGNSGNWNEAQTVTVRALNDGNATDTTSFNLTHSLTAASEPYRSITPDPVAVSVTDAGHGVTVSKASVSVAENSDTETYTIVLKSQPGGPVVITPTSSAPARATVSSALTFTDSNWSTPQTVTVTGAGAGSATISHRVTTTTTAYPTSTTIDSVAVTVTGDTSPAITISGGNAVTEGTAASFTVTASPTPSGNLTVNLNVSETEDFVLSTDEGTDMVTVGTSGTATYTVSTQPDSADESNGEVNVAVETGTGYRVGGSNNMATVEIIDNDATSVTLSGTGTVAEDGSDSRDVTVTLGRNLAAGESVTVPLAISGSGITVSDYTIGLKSGSSLNTGVTLNTTNPHSASAPAVVFTGHDTNTVSVATLEVSAQQDADDEGASETLTVGFGTGSREVTSNLDRASGTGTVGTTTTGTATVTITDDDDPPDYGITITESGSPAETTVMEDGTDTDTYTVVLNTRPAHDVTVTASAGTGVLVNKSGGTAMATQTLTFSPTASANLWSKAQTITVTGVDDDIDNAGNSRTVTIGHAATSTDSNYNITNAGSVSVTVSDDDTAGVTVSEATRTVAENGGEVTYTVVLDSEPLRSVTITVNAGNGSVVKVDGPDSQTAFTNTETLTFTQANWDMPQEVKIQGQDDSTVNSPARSVTISHSIASAGNGDGGRYTTSTAIAGVAVTLTDDDKHSLTLTVTSEGAAEGDSGSQDINFTVSKPAGTSNVNYTLCFSGTATLDVNGTKAAGEDYQVISHLGGTPYSTFSSSCAGSSGYVQMSSANSHTWRIRVFGDGDAELNETVVITLGEHGTSQLPANFEISAANNPATYTIEDDDTIHGLTITETNGDTTVSEDGTTTTDSYTVELKTPPTQDVTVTVTAGAGLQINKSGGSAGGSQTLTFTSSDYSDAQTITVTGVDDSTDNSGGGRSVNISHAASSDDSNYNINSAGTVTVTVTDDDPTAVVLTMPDTTAEEGSTSATAEIRLTLGRGLVNGESLVVPLGFSGGTVGTHFTIACPGSPPTGISCQNLGNSPQVTFTGPSAQAVTLTFSGSEDPNSAGETVTVSIPASSSGSAPKLTATGLPGGASGSRTGNGQITIADNDSAGVSITESGGSTVVGEDGTSDSYDIVLNTQPTHDVTVTVTAGAGVQINKSGGNAGASQTLTFRSSDYSDAQTITVTATDNNTDDDTGRAVGITHSSTSTDQGYNNLTIEGVSATIIDDDATSVTLAGTGTVAEDGSDSVDVTVTLGRNLIANESVTVPLAISGTGITGSDYTIGLKSVNSLNTGVMLNINAPHSAAQPAVVFTGHGTDTVQTATLEIRAQQDTDDEGASEALTVGFGSGDRAVTSNLDLASELERPGPRPRGRLL